MYHRKIIVVIGSFILFSGFNNFAAMNKHVKNEKYEAILRKIFGQIKKHLEKLATLCIFTCHFSYSGKFISKNSKN